MNKPLDENERPDRLYTRSSSFVMALFFTILCGMAALCLGYFIHYFAKGHYVQSAQSVLQSEIKYIKSLPSFDPLPQHDKRLYLLFTDDDKLPTPYNDIATPNRLAEGLITLTDPATDRKYAAQIHTLPDGQKLLLGYDVSDIAEDFLFMRALGIASIVFVMIVVFVSYVISIFVVKGTNKVAQTAQEIIDTGDLSRRVEFGSRWDDMGHMTMVLNGLLDRIEQLMQGVKQVSDNIAHDLRTPLTRLRNKLEALPDDTHKDDLLNEADHILSTFNALLRISRIETQKQRTSFSSVQLENIICDVIDLYEPIAEEKSIQIHHDLMPHTIEGDRDLLFQAFANILDNAIKFTPDQGHISIKMHSLEQTATITFTDSGPGVADRDAKRIFDRFYRAEHSRNSPGTGLGLSLVKAVINLHHGNVTAKNSDTGLSIITHL